METTAEGIESLDQLDLIRKLNVSHVQGFVYSQPVPQAELVERAETGSWSINPAGPAKLRTDRVSLFRKGAAIHDNHRYRVVLPNLSASGAFIQQLLDVPVGPRLVLNFGGEQPATAIGRRSMQHQPQDDV